MRVKSIDHVVLNVSNVKKSATWYQVVLGMDVEETAQRAGAPVRTAVKFGRQKINLRPVDASQEAWFTGVSPTAGSDDLCFLVDDAPERVTEHLLENKVPIEAGPTTKQGALGTIMSIYCRDPDGNLIELSTYP